MPFISKKERQQRIEKLQSADVGKKIFVLISFILAISYTIFVVIMQLLPMLPADMSQGIKDFMGEGAWISTNPETNKPFFTLYGCIMTSITVAIIVMLIVSFFIFLSMKSLRWGFKETIDLMTTPIPGKSGKFAGRTKRIVAKRIAMGNVNKKKKKK